MSQIGATWRCYGKFCKIFGFASFVGAMCKVEVNDKFIVIVVLRCVNIICIAVGTRFEASFDFMNEDDQLLSFTQVSIGEVGFPFIHPMHTYNI